jgi:hypothetical protein
VTCNMSWRLLTLATGFEPASVLVGGDKNLRP